MADILREDILAMVVHDLRNPLACIEGYTTTLQSMPMNEKDRAEILARVLSCTRWAFSLVGDLMDTLAIENGQLSLDRRAVTIESVIRETLESFEVMRQSSGITLNLELSKDSMLVLADPFRIRQVLHNLLNNASKHVPSGSGRIKVAAHHFGGHAVIEVTDNGSGIDPDDQALVFNKFFRKGASSQGSLGLGLYIARSIVEGHGGSIGVRSEGAGKGSTFHFSLPLFNPERTYAEYKKLKAAGTPLPVKMSPLVFADISNGSLQRLSLNH